MAKNGKAGDGYCNGAVTDRVQYYNPQNNRWVKVNTNNNLIIDVNHDL